MLQECSTSFLRTQFSIFRYLPWCLCPALLIAPQVNTIQGLVHVTIELDFGIYWLPSYINLCPSNANPSLYGVRCASSKWLSFSVMTTANVRLTIQGKPHSYVSDARLIMFHFKLGVTLRSLTEELRPGVCPHLSKHLS